MLLEGTLTFVPLRNLSLDSYLSHTGAISPGGPSITVCLHVIISDTGGTNMRTDVLAAALDSGLAISILVIFFCLQFPKNGTVSVSPVNNDSSFKFYRDWRKQRPCVVGVSAVYFSRES